MLIRTIPTIKIIKTIKNIIKDFDFILFYFNPEIRVALSQLWLLFLSFEVN